MFTETARFQRTEQVVKALGSLIEEHGAPNRFNTLDVAQTAGLDRAIVADVGRYQGELVVRSRVVTYKRGWFAVGDDPLKQKCTCLRGGSPDRWHAGWCAFRREADA